jgi:hypothetical protein
MPIHKLNESYSYDRTYIAQFNEVEATFPGFILADHGLGAAQCLSDVDLTEAILFTDLPGERRQRLLL